MNPRVLCPCLDGPLSSVQIDHSGDVDSLTKSSKKLSMSLSWPSQRQQSSASTSEQLTVPNFLNAQLLDINLDSNNAQNIDNDDNDTDEDDNHSPLLANNNNINDNVKINNTQLPIFNHNHSHNSENIPKYVNVQLGGLANGIIQVKEQTSSDSLQDEPNITNLIV